VLPREGSKLNYRLIGFSIGESPKQPVYNIEVAKGDLKDAASFLNSIVAVFECTGVKNVFEVPSFGTDYTWRVVYPGAKTAGTGKMHHFSTLKNEHVDTSLLRLRVMKPAAIQYREDFVSVDAGGVLYDMKGNPVWFIPDTNGIGGYLGDLKFTANHTLTFIRGQDAYEIGFDARVLWKAPTHSDPHDTSHVRYHHEFTKLSNGHYMILGTELVRCKRIKTADSSYTVVSANGTTAEGYRISRFGTLVEYDSKGRVVWSWKSSEHLIGSDFDYIDDRDSMMRIDPHENAFYFDEKNQTIYLGFRDLNRFMKIGYPSGKVTGIYGKIFKPGQRETGSGLFCHQHNILRTHDGLLCFFNNNSCSNTDSMPTVAMLREPGAPGGELEKVWEHTCTAEIDSPKKYASGGNVAELPDGSFFVCMGSEYSKLFIVNRDGKEQWTALPEKYYETEGRWRSNHQYRAAIITRKQYEDLVWSVEQ